MVMGFFLSFFRITENSSTVYELSAYRIVFCFKAAACKNQNYSKHPTAILDLKIVHFNSLTEITEIVEVISATKTYISTLNKSSCGQKL